MFLVSFLRYLLCSFHSKMIKERARKQKLVTSRRGGGGVFWCYCLTISYFHMNYPINNLAFPLPACQQWSRDYCFSKNNKKSIEKSPNRVTHAMHFNIPHFPSCSTEISSLLMQAATFISHVLEYVLPSVPQTGR